MGAAPQPGEFVLGESFAAILTETTQSLVCVFDREGRILLFNDACERATGFRREELLGRDAREFVIPAEERDAFGEFLAHVWKTRAPSPQVGHWRTKAGGRRLIAWSNRPMAGDDGNNQTGWKNAEYDRLIAAAGNTADQAKRLEYFQRCEQILAEECPLLPMS